MMRVGTATGFLALAIASAVIAADEGFKTIFDGQSASGWITSKSSPVPKANVQPDGLNPHGAGGYLVVYEKPVGDFVLDFDYKIAPKCNSGVFVRVGDLKDPVMSGLEIAIDDVTGTDLHAPGAFYDLVAPKVNAQKPAGEWNHMMVIAKGPKLSVNLNGQDVSAIDLNEWPKAGERPDGSKHKFTKVAIKDFNRPGYFGFQDHGSDCWYKNIKLKEAN